jgi:hypothetical protein
MLTDEVLANCTPSLSGLAHQSGIGPTICCGRCEDRVVEMYGVRDDASRMGRAGDWEPMVTQLPNGRWFYRLVSADGDPAKWESDGHSYLTYEDADRSARLSLAAKLLRE